MEPATNAQLTAEVQRLAIEVERMAMVIRYLVQIAADDNRLPPWVLHFREGDRTAIRGELPLPSAYFYGAPPPGAPPGAPAAGALPGAPPTSTAQPRPVQILEF